MSQVDCAVVGGGAAGFFGAISCAEAGPSATIRLCESGPKPLAKVAISGGGRCNVTHACFEPADLAAFYPRGGRELLGPFHRWQPRETMAWFADRGVSLKTEEDGRVFPESDDSATIIDCLVAAAKESGIRWAPKESAKRVTREEGGYRIHLATGESFTARRVLVATGGGAGSAGLEIARSLGHTIEAPVPSLFTFHIADPRIQGLAGVSAPEVSVRIEPRLKAQGPLLITHWGMSGPAILKLSAWGARELAGRGYRFELIVAWSGELSPARVQAELAHGRRDHPRRRIVTGNPFSLPHRLWERLLTASGIPESVNWSALSKAQSEALAGQLTAGRFQVAGKSMNKEEFVTCGGVRLSEVDFKTMESKLQPGLFFAGEVLDLDGLTGGFNLQAAWTTGRLAGLAMAVPPPPGV